MRKGVVILLSVVLASILAGSVFAQSARTQSAGMSPPVGQFGEFRGQPLIGVNEVVGKQALSADGKQVGVIQNVLVSSNGREAYIMLSGQRLGKSGQFIPVPWVMAEPTISDGNVILQLTEQTLRQAPGISSSQTHRLGQMLPEINGYYGGFQGEMMGRENGMGMQPGTGMMGRGGFGPGYGTMGYGYGYGYGPGCGYGPCPECPYVPGYGRGYGAYPGPGGRSYYPGMGYGAGTGYYGGMGFDETNYGGDNF